MEILLNILIIWLIAELGSAVVHWAEMRYGNAEWKDSKNWLKRKIYEEVIGPNVAHHSRPSLMNEGTFWFRNRSSIVPAFILAGLSFLFWPTYWSVYCGFILLGFSNQIHGFAHLPKNKSNWLIRFFQRIGIFQSPKHHKTHHTSPFDCNFAVCTNYLNPVLEFIRFWAILEFIVWLIFGLKPLKSRESA